VGERPQKRVLRLRLLPAGASYIADLCVVISAVLILSLEFNSQPEKMLIRKARTRFTYSMSECRNTIYIFKMTDLCGHSWPASPHHGVGQAAAGIYACAAQDLS
jgi:hypothetical protein